METGVAHTQSRFKPAGAIYCFFSWTKAPHSAPQNLCFAFSSTLSSTKAPHSTPQNLHSQLHTKAPHPTCCNNAVGRSRTMIELLVIRRPHTQLLLLEYLKEWSAWRIAGKAAAPPMLPSCEGWHGGSQAKPQPLHAAFLWRSAWRQSRSPSNAVKATS